MFNVRNAEGKHIGFVSGRVSSGQEFVVALSEVPLDNSRINWDLVKSRLADLYECRNFWGKVKEEVLLDKVKEAWDHGYAKDVNFFPANAEDYYKLHFLDHGCDLSQCIDSDALGVYGYIFLDGSKLSFCEGDILLEAEVDYIEEKVQNTAPIYGVVADYPRIGISMMGNVEGLLLGADFADFGRNHSHQTRVRIKTGNVVKEFKFPLQIVFRKGCPVQIYLTKAGEITSVFCDGAIYLMNYEEDQYAYSLDPDRKQKNSEERE